MKKQIGKIFDKLLKNAGVQMRTKEQIEAYYKAERIAKVEVAKLIGKAVGDKRINKMIADVYKNSIKKEVK